MTFIRRCPPDDPACGFDGDISVTTSFRSTSNQSVDAAVANSGGELITASSNETSLRIQELAAAAVAQLRLLMNILSSMRVTNAAVPFDIVQMIQRLGRLSEVVENGVTNAIVSGDFAEASRLIGSAEKVATVTRELLAFQSTNSLVQSARVTASEAAARMAELQANIRARVRAAGVAAGDAVEDIAQAQLGLGALAAIAAIAYFVIKNR